MTVSRVSRERSEAEAGGPCRGMNGRLGVARGSKRKRNVYEKQAISHRSQRKSRLSGQWRYRHEASLHVDNSTIAICRSRLNLYARWQKRERFSLEMRLRSSLLDPIYQETTLNIPVTIFRHVWWIILYIGCRNLFIFYLVSFDNSDRYAAFRQTCNIFW